VLLGRVTGQVVSTLKHKTYAGRSLMIVQPLVPGGPGATDALVPDGDPVLAVDHAQSGPGDLVLVLSEGNGIRQLLGEKVLPIRRLIVGVVDAVDLPGCAA